jgi:hypothetical protein
MVILTVRPVEVAPDIRIFTKGGEKMNCIIPAIANCNVENCAYNKLNKCHALAVTIGDGGNPRCDTSLISVKKGGIFEITGGVGACKVESCQYNDSLECSAKSISVWANVDEAAENALCSTYQARM